MRVLRLKVEHDFNNKSESRKFSFLVEKSYITKQLLTSISVDMSIYLPIKVIFTSV